MFITRQSIILKVAVAGILLCSSAATRVAHAQTAHVHGDEQRVSGALLDTVRESTARFKDVAVAESEGYSLLFGCVTGDEAGAMGLHYVNLGLYANADGTFDDVIDPYQPEIILYEPTPWGPKLTGADYIVDAETWNKTHAQAPELDGQIFHFFDAPNRFGLRPFYTLHVWAWKDSPTGTFVNWNKDVRCDAHNGPNK